MNVKKWMKDFFLENKLYKVVALVLSLILWVNILGSKSWGLTHDLPLQIVLKPGFIITSQVPKTVTVRLSGLETNVKKYLHSGATVTIDAGSEEGWKTFVIESKDIDVPIGVEVLSVFPKKIRLYLEKSKE